MPCPCVPEVARTLTLGQVLRHRREELGLSELDVATGAGVDTVDVINYETGVRVPYPRTLERLALVLELPFSDLIELRRPKSTKGS